jgi:hypothetical protein
VAAALAVFALGAILASSAGAATVVNGDFEAGSLTGWTSVEPPLSSGRWFSYTGTESPLPPSAPGEVQAPPQGKYAATSDQEGPGVHVLYQDVALEPGRSQALSMLVYYWTSGKITSPDSLSPEGAENQQYRIDVMRPSSPIYSVAPGDILSTVFRTLEGDPMELAPRSATVDLSQFAGQTVRIRLAEVDNLGNFYAGADAISIATGPPPPSPQSNSFTFGKLKLNKKKGTGRLGVNVPGPGTLTAVDAITSASKSASSSKARKKRQALIKNAAVTTTAAGVATLNLKPTGAGKKILNKKGKLSFKASVTFTPTGGTAATQQFKGKLKLTRKKKKG